MASVNTAKNPISSTKTIYSINKYINNEVIMVNTSIQSRYDWKSDQFQKFLASKSEKKLIVSSSHCVISRCETGADSCYKLLGIDISLQ